MTDVTIEKAIEAVIKLRNKKTAVEAQIKEEVSAIKAKIDKLEAFIKVQADELGVTSFKTAAGTAFLTTTDYANVENWSSVLEFIKEQGAYDLLEKRVNKSAVRTYMDQLNMVPPGINYGTMISVNVRKPTAKDN
jgi:hypothetical protein